MASKVKSKSKSSPKAKPKPAQTGDHFQKWDNFDVEAALAEASDDESLDSAPNHQYTKGKRTETDVSNSQSIGKEAGGAGNLRESKVPVLNRTPSSSKDKRPLRKPRFSFDNANLEKLAGSSAQKAVRLFATQHFSANGSNHSQISISMLCACPVKLYMESALSSMPLFEQEMNDFTDHLALNKIDDTLFTRSHPYL